MDKIKIKNLEVFAKHGVFPEENTLGQKFLVSAILYTDTREAGLTDDLTASIHYGETCQFIQRFLQEHTYQLIERAAEALGRDIASEYPEAGTDLPGNQETMGANRHVPGDRLHRNRTLLAHSLHCTRF